MSKPYRVNSFGIVNHVGGIWTPRTFATEEDAAAHLASATVEWGRRYKCDLSRHRVVPVRVTISVIKPKAPATHQSGKADQ